MYVFGGDGERLSENENGFLPGYGEKPAVELENYSPLFALQFWYGVLNSILIFCCISIKSFCWSFNVKYAIMYADAVYQCIQNIQSAFSKWDTAIKTKQTRMQPWNNCNLLQLIDYIRFIIADFVAVFH